ncbi:MAG: hypothetical protein V4618_13525 [Pseudomonadota bacterium]
MSGILQAVAGGVTSVVASPLNCFASVTGGSVPLHVASAAGNTNGVRMFTANGSGGVPPYTYTWSRQNSANKTVLESRTGPDAYVSWSGMLVGEYQSTTANCEVRDASGATATSSTIVIGIQRDS